MEIRKFNNDFDVYNADGELIATVIEDEILARKVAECEEMYKILLAITSDGESSLKYNTHIRILEVLDRVNSKKIALVG